MSATLRYNGQNTSKLDALEFKIRHYLFWIAYLLAQ